MQQHFIPHDATVAELERKAADAEEKASNESEPRAAELRKRRSSIENGPQPSGLGDGRLKRVVRVIACSRQLRFRRSIIFVEFAGVHDTLLVLRKIRR